MTDTIVNEPIAELAELPRTMRTTDTCPVCGKTYARCSAHQAWCSAKCAEVGSRCSIIPASHDSSISHEERMKRCWGCGEMMPSGCKKYCTEQCRQKATYARRRKRKAGVWNGKACRVCGKKLTGLLRVYCSAECSRVHRNKLQHEQSTLSKAMCSHRHHRKFTCAWCGKLVIVTPHTNDHRHKYCDKLCCMLATADRQSVSKRIEGGGTLRANPAGNVNGRDTHRAINLIARYLAGCE